MVLRHTLINLAASAVTSALGAAQDDPQCDYTQGVYCMDKPVPRAQNGPPYRVGLMFTDYANSGLGTPQTMMFVVHDDSAASAANLKDHLSLVNLQVGFNILWEDSRDGNDDEAALAAINSWLDDETILLDHLIIRTLS